MSYFTYSSTTSFLDCDEDIKIKELLNRLDRYLEQCGLIKKLVSERDNFGREERNDNNYHYKLKFSLFILLFRRLRCLVIRCRNSNQVFKSFLMIF